MRILINERREEIMYKKVELKEGFVGMEQEVAKRWQDKNIIKKITI